MSIYPSSCGGNGIRGDQGLPGPRGLPGPAGQFDPAAISCPVFSAKVMECLPFLEELSQPNPSGTIRYLGPALPLTIGDYMPLPMDVDGDLFRVTRDASGAGLIVPTDGFYLITQAMEVISEAPVGVEFTPITIQMDNPQRCGWLYFS